MDCTITSTHGREDDDVAWPHACRFRPGEDGLRACDDDGGGVAAADTNVDGLVDVSKSCALRIFSARISVTFSCTVFCRSFSRDFDAANSLLRLSNSNFICARTGLLPLLDLTKGS